MRKFRTYEQAYDYCLDHGIDESMVDEFVIDDVRFANENMEEKE